MGRFDRYAERFDLLELSAGSSSLPRAARLRAWASSAPAGFRFAVAVPGELSSLGEGEAARAALDRVTRLAAAVGASWIVLRTERGLRPSARGERALAGWVARLTPLGARVAWEPGGLWEDAHAELVAHRLGVVRATDLSRHEPTGPVVYGRVSRLGAGDRATASVAERVADRLRGADEAHVVVEPKGARRFAGILRRALGEETS